MSNDSSTGGFLAPSLAPAPFEGQALFRFIQGLLVGLTLLPGELVRPRWQLEPPNLPDVGTNWCAFGITTRVTDVNAFVRHVEATPPYDELQRHEELTILVSFYGPAADANAEVLRDGLQIAQNRELLQQNSMGLIQTTDAVTVPELVKELWLYRVDISVKIRRQIVRQYPVLDLASSVITLNNEQYTVTINN